MPKFIGKRKIYDFMKSNYNLHKINNPPETPDYQGTDNVGARFFDLKTRSYYVLSGGIWYKENKKVS